MGAEVFQLNNRQFSHRSSPKSNPNPNLNRSGGRKRSSGQNTATVDKPSPAKGLAMEQVKILKRGEALEDQTNTSINAMLKSDNDKLKPFGKVGDRRRAELKDEKKVKLEGVVKKVVAGMKDEKKIKFESDVKDVAINSKDVKEVEVNSKYDLVLPSLTDDLGPAPEMVPKVHCFHAGFVIESPSPSSLPMPAFFAKKSDPTIDLIQMLRLNL